MERFLFLGDSLTACGRNQARQATDLGGGFVKILQEHFNQENRAITCINKAYKGAKLGHVYQDVHRQLPELKPIHRVSLLAGVNDVWYERERSASAWAAYTQQWTQTYLKLLEALDDKLNQPQWLLMEPIANFQKPQLAERLVSLQEAWQQIPQQPRRTKLALAATFKREPELYFSKDHIHLSKEGQALLTQEIEAVLKLS